MYDEKYKPISPFGYLGYELLFALPIVGWIIQLVFAINHSNINVRNFARSFYCVYVFGIILWLVLVFLGSTLK